MDLDEFAAKLAALDLVISVGNATAHLAGALGVPTWVLLPKVPGWRWLIDGERNPWYASVRAIRQTTAGVWNPVFEELSTRLRASVNRVSRGAAIASVRVPLAMPVVSRERAPPSSPPRFDLQKSLDDALARYRAGDLQMAEAALNEILAHSPRNVRALHCLGQIARQSGRLDLAIRTLTRAASAAEDQAAIWLDLARAQCTGGMREEAIASYRRLLAVDARHGEGWFELAGTLRGLGRHEEAHAAYCSAAPLQFTNPKLFNFLGGTCLELKRYDEAERAFRRAVELSPNYFAAWNNLGCALERQEKFDEAMTCFGACLKLRRITRRPQKT